MPKQDKKQRRAAKQAQKKKEARRHDSISPLKRLADAPGEAECWATPDFELNGQLSIHAFKRGDGLSGQFSFLIDRGVVGLKDTWSVIPIEPAQRQMIFDASRERGFALQRITSAAALAWIAGAARWTNENGMKLPKDWLKIAAVVGDVGDWHHADVSAFKKEFAGHPEDLRQRLIAESFESYMKRKDIAFTFSDGAPFKDQRTGRYSNLEEYAADDEEDIEEVDELFSSLTDAELNDVLMKYVPVAAELTKQTGAWLAAKGKSPSSELPNAWKLIVVVTTLSNNLPAESDMTDDDKGDLSHDWIVELSQRITTDSPEELHRAIGQCIQHLLVDQHLMVNASIKIAPPDEGDSD